MVESKKSARPATSGFDRFRHICVLYNSMDEEYRVVQPFIREGFPKGDKAFHIIDNNLRTAHLQRLQEIGIDVTATEQSGQLEVRGWEAAHLRPGWFDQHAMLALVEDVLTDSKRRGFQFVRWVANMGWALGGYRGAEDLVEYCTRLFQMFSQVDSALERSQGGLGIGLALVRGLVEMHGGRVEAKSAGLGQGSEFTVYLPALPEPRVEPSADGDGKAPARTGYRILVVDDNEDCAESLSLMLRLMGHETYSAHDGLEAVEAAGRYQPDLVLLDIGLPKMNGYQVARLIREQAWGRKMVLVAVTGWGQDEDIQRAREVGFDHHLTKPAQLDALKKLLAKPLPAHLLPTSPKR